MGIKEDFDSAMREWKSYSISDTTNASFDHTNCDGFRRIVALGKPALPFIRDEFRATWLIGGGSLVKQILGDEIDFPREIQGHGSAIRAHILAWLDANLPAD